jgi:hypothetical protein
MTRTEKTATSRTILSLALGITTLGSVLGISVEQASALPLLDLVPAALNTVLGQPQQPQRPTNDLQLMNGNLNGNNLTLCSLTCGGLPGLGNPTAARPPLPSGIPSGLPPGAGFPSGGRPPLVGSQSAPRTIPGAPAQRPNAPTLLIPPIPLPNPF